MDRTAIRSRQVQRVGSQALARKRPAVAGRRLIYPEDGRLATGLLYELRTDQNIETAKLLYQRSETWIHPPPASETYVYCEVARAREREFNCDRGAHHRTGNRLISATIDSTFGGENVASFVANSEFLIVAAEFGGKLVNSGLSGVSSSPINVRLYQSAAKDFRVHRLIVSGNCQIRRYQIGSKHENECPYCGFGPILCSDCGFVTRKCRDCKRGTVVPILKHQGEDDLRWAQDRLPGAGPIIDGASWDGHDFCRGWGAAVVTKKAVNWLLKEKATGWAAVPLRVDVSHLSQDRIRFMEESS